MKPVKLIVCIYPDAIIGINNTLPIRINEDMKFFKDITIQTSNPFSKNSVIMGWNTFKSIPDKHLPLKDRINIVLTSKDEPLKDNIYKFNTLEHALEFCNSNDEIENIFIIGGKKLYEYSINNNLIDEMYITHITEPDLITEYTENIIHFPIDLIKMNDWHISIISEIKCQGFLFKEKIYKDVFGNIKHYIKCPT